MALQKDTKNNWPILGDTAAPGVPLTGVPEVTGAGGQLITTLMAFAANLYQTAASQAARLALTGLPAGALVRQDDDGITYRLLLYGGEATAGNWESTAGTVSSGVAITIRNPPIQMTSVDEAYSFTPEVTAGSPTTWSITNEAALVAVGLTLNPSTGVISGTPTAALAASTRNLTAIDGSGNSDTVPFTIRITDDPLSITGHLVWLDGLDAAAKLDAGAAPADIAEEIATWTNKSTSAVADAVQTGANKPVNRAESVEITADQELTIADSADISFGNAVTDTPFTIAVWATVDANAPARLVTKAVDTNSREILFYMESPSDTIRATLYDADGNNKIDVIQDIDYNAHVDTPHLLVFTYDGSAVNTGLVLSQNRVVHPATRTSLGTYVAMHDTAAPLSIGRFIGGTVTNIQQFHEVVVLDHVATAAELETIYNYRRNDIRSQPTTHFDSYEQAANVWFTKPQALYSATANKTWVCYQGQYSMICEIDHDAATVNHYAMGDVQEWDDHNNPAIVRRSDGKLLVAWCEHNTSGNLRYRISTNVDDASAFGAETAITLTGFTVSYTILMQTADGKIHWFFRRLQTTGATYTWCQMTSTDNGATWGAVKVLTAAGANQQYMTAAVSPIDGNRIDVQYQFASGNAAQANLIQYHWYYKSDTDTYHASDGTQIDTGATLPMATAAMTIVANGTAGGHYYWGCDVHHDIEGVPVMLCQKAVAGASTGMLLVLFRYSAGTWSEVTIADIGATPSDPTAPVYSEYYSGLGRFITANRVILSQQLGSVGAHEISCWRSADDGDTWIKERQVTSGSGNQQIRPIVAQGAPEGSLGWVAWFGGVYDGFTSFRTRLQLGT